MSTMAPVAAAVVASAVRVARIEVLTAQLPFRFSFAHALAERHSSTNVYVKLTLDDGTAGYGEGVPREYVTGETVDGAVAALADRFAPAAVDRSVSSADDVPSLLDNVRRAGARSGEIGRAHV